MRILLTLMLFSLLTACYPPNAVRVDGVGEVRYYDDHYDDHEHHHHYHRGSGGSRGGFCPPGQAMKNRC